MKNMMIKKATTVSMLAGTVALMGCSQGSEDQVLTQFFREAGTVVDSGEFGNSTLNNRLVMTGDQQYTQSLSNRFASEVNSTVNFAFNSAQLDAAAQETLRQQANWIKQFPEVRFRVYGHTDLVGSNGYNKRLGMRRARAVVNFLTSQGISRSRLQAVVSHGEAKPLIVTQGRERQNRRTVTDVVGFVKNHPAVLDGKYAQIIYREYVASAVPASSLSSLSIQTGSGSDG